MDDAVAQPKIVLADDEQFIAIAYKTGLEQAGYEVFVAHDGDAAYDLIQSVRPDLVLLDIIMPKSNGFEVLDELQHNPELANIPVIVLTNLSQESDRAEAVRLGARDFVTKADVSLNDLLQRIKKVL